MARKTKGSSKWTLNKEDAKHIGKVLAFTVATALVAAGIDLVSAAEFAPELYWVPATINVALVAAKKWLTENK
jgi:hypothetical protein